jgi:hypothetical protein
MNKQVNIILKHALDVAGFGYLDDLLLPLVSQALRRIRLSKRKRRRIRTAHRRLTAGISDPIQPGGPGPIIDPVNPGIIDPVNPGGGRGYAPGRFKVGTNHRSVNGMEYGNVMYGMLTTAVGALTTDVIPLTPVALGGRISDLANMFEEWTGHFTVKVHPIIGTDAAGTLAGAIMRRSVKLDSDTNAELLSEITQSGGIIVNAYENLVMRHREKGWRNTSSIVDPDSFSTYAYISSSRVAAAEDVAVIVVQYRIKFRNPKSNVIVYYDIDRAASTALAASVVTMAGVPGDVIVVRRAVDLGDKNVWPGALLLCTDEDAGDLTFRALESNTAISAEDLTGTVFGDIYHVHNTTT